MDTDDVLTDWELELLNSELTFAALGIPEPTSAESALIANLLPPNYGKPKPAPEPRRPAASLTTGNSEKISIRVPHAILASVVAEAHRRGIKWQTFANQILAASVCGQRV